MPQPPKVDVFAAFDPILHAVDITSSPWVSGRYVPDLDLLRELLSIPISTG